MPNVNGKEFDYGTAGVKAAKKEAAKTGKKITYNYGGGGVVPKTKLKEESKKASKSLKKMDSKAKGSLSGLESGLKSGLSGIGSGLESGLKGYGKAVEDDMKKAGKALKGASGEPKKYKGGGVVRGAGAATRGIGFYKG